MSRLHGSLFFVVVTGVSLLFRVLASIGQPVARFPDSAGYERIGMWGTIDRFWPIPLVFSLLQSDVARVIGHVLIGVLAWTWLAHVVSRLSAWPRTAFVLVMFVGLSPEIIRYDVALLSESLGISFAVCALAATLQRRLSTTTTTLILWLASIGLCAMTRPTHLVVLGVAVIPSGVAWIKTRNSTTTITASVLVVLCVIGLVQLRSNTPTSILNFYTVLSERIITDDSRYNWFVSQGMPDIEGVRTASGYDYPYQLPPDVADIVRLPTGQAPPTVMRVGGVQLAHWATMHGWSTYVRYVIAHPGDTIERLTTLLDATLSPPNTDFLPLDNGPMIPSLFFQTWQLWVALLVAGIISQYLNPKTRQRAYLLAVVTLTLVIIYTATTLTSGIEHPRHAVTVAALVRILAVITVLTTQVPPTITRKVDELVDEHR